MVLPHAARLSAQRQRRRASADSCGAQDQYATLAASREAAADLVIARGLDAMKDEIASGMRSALSSSKPQLTIEN